ncbi:uncharacterized protein LOC125509750 [Triticum urartu]|uniref:uncharacterized protein LOC125509750 n=1 Tax=Triticum urartu TaxID=4572 RepID=UPI0020437405|nr:uncharacterized protein LOC125509750 [Triticum urartu]
MEYMFQNSTSAQNGVIHRRLLGGECGDGCCCVGGELLPNPIDEVDGEVGSGGCWAARRGPASWSTAASWGGGGRRRAVPAPVRHPRGRTPSSDGAPLVEGTVHGVEKGHPCFPVLGSTASMEGRSSWLAERRWSTTGTGRRAWTADGGLQN